MAKSTTATTTADTSVSIDDLSAQIATLKNDVASLTATLGQYGKAKTEEMRKTATTTAHDLTDAGRAKALEAQKQAEEFIIAQPATALGIAAGVGFLVGLVTARR
tara:strand:+ start:52812 stop:53126 length:315 start_codon:yes stop_codon:yes gene_type:complete